MIRITAINEDTDIEDEDDNHVTKEAEETIVMSEYLRAMKLQKEKYTDDALSLFTQLLQTQVLYEVTKSHTSKTLISIKYNCYKNIGFIHSDQKNDDKALEYLIEAVEMDDTDIFTLNKLGQIALSMKQLDVAQIVLEKCLKKNPNYWPAGDGILRILCERENYNEAYGWALLWYEKNPRYQLALDVILEVRERFGGSGFEYIESSWSTKFKDIGLKRTNKQSVFPGPSFDVPPETPKLDIDQYKIDAFEKENWLSVGTMIAGVYEHLKAQELPLHYRFKYSDFLRNGPIEEVKVEHDSHHVDEEMPLAGETTDAELSAIEQPQASEEDAQTELKQENGQPDGIKCSNSNNADGGNSADGSNDDSDAPTNTGDEEPKNTGDEEPKNAGRPRSRRRGSDLKSLEPWCFWDRNRKYSQRQKNKQLERMENDTTVNAYLRKILKSHFDESFDDESPFHPGQKYEELCKSKASDELNDNGQSDGSLEHFQVATSQLYTAFVDHIKATDMDAMDLVKLWTQYVSKCWNRKLPDGMIDLYMKLYRYYTDHFDLSAWNQLQNGDFHDAFRMTLFYLELKHAEALKTAKPDQKNELDDEWIRIFHPFTFYAGISELDENDIESMHHQIRSIWLQYCISRYEYDLQRSVNCLETIKDLIQSDDHAIRLHLPNLDQHRSINLSVIDDLTVTLERTISLNNVRRLYLAKSYEELIFVLKDSLAVTTRTINATSSVMKVSTQFEIILECFWNVELFDECLIWSERCLKYALDSFVSVPKSAAAHLEWAKNVTFILTYIEALITEKSYSILRCLNTYCARLVQSIVQIVTLQLDAPQERNANHLHPIDLKKPWIILHHIVQREDDIKSYQAKKRLTIGRSESTDSSATYEPECGLDEEESLPNAIAILFTAHEYLGARSWCTKDNGQLMLFGLELIVPLLRAPCLELYRDYVAEYLEQMTYCLYGYPAKKARLKHIEEHDAQNIELEWKHAVLLYELFRPDDLPLYNSYQKDSITQEMEQLLQKIIALIPEDVDLSKRAGEMEKFISGELTELPEALDILPSRISSIYYLLADHYFKYRDPPKSVEYYTYDLSNCPKRFDAWAGMALAKASMMEVILSTSTEIPTKEWLQQSEEVLRCYQQCLTIGGDTVYLWIEYGSYAYALHSYCSRCLKQSSDTLSMEKFEELEQKKNDCLKLAQECFVNIDTLSVASDMDKVDKSEEDEKWLYHYMLGKVAEKRKDPPKAVIDHYLKSAQHLYEHNANYPIKISSSNPQPLALEALEVFYRITALIVKYLEQHSVVTTAIGRYFIKVLKQQAKSPFAINQAKINENSVNAFKRKISMALEEAAKKIAKIDTSSDTQKIIASNSSKTNDKSASAEQHKLASDQNTDDSATNREASFKTVLESKDCLESTQKMGESAIIGTAEPMDTQETAEKDGELLAQSVKAPSQPGTCDTPKENAVSPSSVTTRTASTESAISDRDHASRNASDKCEAPQNPIIVNLIESEIGKRSSLRRGSQESTATTTTTTTTTSESTSSSSESTSADSSSSDSDDTSSSEDDLNKDPNAPLDAKYIEMIFEMCIKNLEECVTRFPEHYKSIYRLVHVYLHGPDSIKSLEKCNSLLLGTYTTTLGNFLQGLFTDRKNNNLFSGIWRNPSTEIERPGSFSSHLTKCVNILMQILRKNLDYKLLLEVISHLQRVPDSDKRYVKESERVELLENAMAFCVQSFKDLIRKYTVEERNDSEMLILIVEIFKSHKKCLKNASQKDSPYASTLVDAYKAYIQGKVDWLPDNVNHLDLATKLCNNEINAKKNVDKQQPQPPQYAVGRLRMLDELGFSSLAASLTKLTPMYPTPMMMAAGPNVQLPNAPMKVPVSMAPGMSISLAMPPAVPMTMPMIMPVPGMASITAVTCTTAATITPIPTPTMSITMVNQPATQLVQAQAASAIPGARPRGRPPGSKNVNTKPVNMPVVGNPLSSLINPMHAMSSQLPDLNHITSHLEPTIRQKVLELLSTSAFMQTLARFTEPNSMTTFLKEYLRLANYDPGQVPELVSAFMDVLSRLAMALNASNALMINPMAAKPAPKVTTKKQPAASKQAAMSITAVPQMQTVHPVTSLATNTTVTPVPHAVPNFMAPGSSAVISVGSGQLTITPSISITANPQPVSTSLPQLPLPNFGATKQPKQPKQPKDKSKSVAPKMYPDLAQINIPMDLPKSLSIIPSSTSLTPTSAVIMPKGPIPAPPMNVEIVPNPKRAPAKRAAEPKPQTNILQSHTYIKPNVLGQQLPPQPMLMVDQWKQLLQSNVNDAGFMSQFKQFLSAPPDPMAGPAAKIMKTNASMNVSGGRSKGTIKVKQLDQLTNKPKATAKQKTTTAKSNTTQAQAYVNPIGMAGMASMAKGQPIPTVANLMNSYGLANAMQPIPSSTFTMASGSAATLPSNLTSHPTINLTKTSPVQISPTKSLQQKLAERQRQFFDGGPQSRPSSTSSAASVNTRKSDNDVIVLD